MDEDLEFRQRLYRLSTRLSSEDVRNMKFYCTDEYLSRRQLEAVESGFHLFCQLVDKGTLSKDNTGFLEELLDLVNKRSLLQQLCNRSLQENDGLPFRSLAEPIFKTLLKELGDSLPQKQLKDVFYFFSGSTLAVQDIQDLRKPEEMFQKLKDGGTSVGVLLLVLETIGRRDLCEKVRKRCPDVQSTISSTGAMTRDPEGSVSRPVEEESGRTDNPEDLFSPSSTSYVHLASASLPSLRSSISSQVSIQYRDGIYHGTPSSAGGESSQSEASRLKEVEQNIEGGMRKVRQGIEEQSLCDTSLLERMETSRKEASELRLSLMQKGDLELYPMECSPHGLAVVIVNECFEESGALRKRQGAEVDQVTFCQVFEDLGYTSEAYYNCTADEMLKIIERVAEMDHSRYDSFVLCVSTHGTDTCLYGIDNKVIKRKHLFAPMKLCDTLRGKPKMFFIQACRTAASSDREADGLVDPHDEADCFYASASTSGNSAYRDTNSGSWFVTALWEVFSKMKSTHTLISMMHCVNAWLQQKYSVLSDGSSCIQCAEYTSTCTKDIRFCK